MFLCLPGVEVLEFWTVFQFLPTLYFPNSCCHLCRLQPLLSSFTALLSAKSLSCSSASLTASYHISKRSSTLISKLFLVFSFSKHIACVLGITYVNSPAFKAAGPSLENKLYSPNTPGLQCLSCHSHLHLTQ